MSDHYLLTYRKEGFTRLSSYIKFTSKTWKIKHCLIVGKYVTTFGDNSEGFTDFNKWKHENITEKIQNQFSK